MTSNFTTPILSSNSGKNLERLTEFAEFWKIPYARQITSLRGDPIFSSGKTDFAVRSGHPTVVSPSGPEDSRKIASDYGLEVRQRKATLTLPVKNTEPVALDAIIYEFQGSRLEPVISSDNGTYVLSRIEGTGIHLLSLDIVREYEERLYGGIEDSPSTRFKLISRLPVPYNIVPRPIRDWSLRRSLTKGQQDKEPAPVEFLRLVFLAALATVSENPIPRLAFWRKGKTYAMAVTHDIETSEGLNNGTGQLLRIEKDVKVRSTWNIPTDRYKLSARGLTELAKEGDIGAHDTFHDGRLILSPLEEKISRARQAKEKLEKLSGVSVFGFRAPLLQHSQELLSAIGKAGYEFDSSTPSSEWVSPTSSKPHGTGTVFPFQYEDIWEIPVSLPQDHQLIRIRQLSTNEAVKVTLKTASHLRALGGACILLVHPDYDYASLENEQDYRQLVDFFTVDPKCAVMTMKELVTWWKVRNGARITLSDAEPRIVNGTRTESSADGLHIETITGYDQNGLRIENRS
jgi:hypothetical protein